MPKFHFEIKFAKGAAFDVANVDFWCMDGGISERFNQSKLLLHTKIKWYLEHKTKKKTYAKYDFNLFWHHPKQQDDTDRYGYRTLLSSALH